MSKSKLIAAMSMVGALAVSNAASAATYTVEATNDMSHWLDLGTFTSGTTYSLFVIDPSTLWSAGNDIPYSRVSNANGIPASRGYGQYTFDGFTANYGALVGEDSSGFFLIGTGAKFNDLSGDVKVGYWDSDYTDNSGVQTLSVEVPEPAAWALMLLGFGGVGALLRRRAAVAPAV